MRSEVVDPVVGEEGEGAERKTVVTRRIYRPSISHSGRDRCDQRPHEQGYGLVKGLGVLTGAFLEYDSIAGSVIVMLMIALYNGCTNDRNLSVETSGANVPRKIIDHFQGISRFASFQDFESAYAQDFEP